MQRLPLRRALSAAASAPVRRALSTASRRPPWAMVEKYVAVGSPERRVSLRLAEPPCGSRLIAPAHLVGYAPRVPDPDTDELNAFFAGFVKAASGDGLLLLTFMEVTGTAPLVPGGGGWRALTGISIDPDMTRFVCNPISGELFGLPDIDGTKRPRGSPTSASSPNPNARTGRRTGMPEDSVGYRGGDERFAMRRFLSQTGKWDKLVGLPSSLPLHRRRMNTSTQEVVAFAGRLWWVDLSWGALSADPFSDRPELRFVELPRGSVTQPMEKERRELCRFRRVGVSEGRLRYAEVSQEEPFVLSSFALDDDGGGWTLEHRVALRRLWPHDQNLCKNTPQIAAIDPLNAGCMHLVVGRQVVSIDMDNGDLLGCTLGGGSDPSVDTLTPCLLPPWLASCRIPRAETLSRNKADAKSKSLSDMLEEDDLRPNSKWVSSIMHVIFMCSNWLHSWCMMLSQEQQDIMYNDATQDANPTATGRRTHSRCPLRAPGLVHQLTQLQNPTCRGLSELHPPRLFGFSFTGKPTTPKMQRLPLRRALSAAASVAARRALSTAASSPSRTPPWAMIYHIPAVRSTAPRAFFILVDPPGASNLYVPDHLFDRRPGPGPGPDNGDVMALLGGMVCTTSGDGLLLLCYSDAHAPVVSTHSGLS
uniref:DUF1618 domain-containing protein n=1 Tax=Oryza glumipatula TaxID=40148 RepID=A0A0D9ZW82_9ORYZ